MNLLQSLKRPFSSLFYSLLSRAPSAWAKKLSMTFDLWAADTRRFRKFSPMALAFSTPPDIEQSFDLNNAGEFGNLDEESIANLRRFVAKVHFLPDSTHLYTPPPPYAFLWGGLCSQKEFDEAVANEKRLDELRERYHLGNKDVGVSSLVHHHGLRQLPTHALAALQDTVFVDAGAFQGDSTLVFLQYTPRVVWAFEPSPPNQALFRANMAANQVPDSAVRLIPQGLSDKPATIRFAATASSGCSLASKGRCKAELVPLDSLTPPTRIGLVKADLEGMGMSMLRGAVETIRRDKPVLSLSIYHNADEFLNTYAFLRGLGVPYHCKILSLCPPWENHELTLLAWPRN